jgi:hypothetical protein
MNALESECLRQDDIRLFHKGACHVFAAVLKHALLDEDYSLKRVVLMKAFGPKDAYHVFAAADDFVVDASGIKRASDYVAWLTARHVEKNFGTTDIPLVKLLETSEEELFAHHHDDPHHGSVNQWDLFSGEEFVAVARARAEVLIEHWPEKYRVSILKTGLALQPK